MVEWSGSHIRAIIKKLFILRDSFVGVVVIYVLLKVFVSVWIHSLFSLECSHYQYLSCSCCGAVDQ